MSNVILRPTVKSPEDLEIPHPQKLFLEALFIEMERFFILLRPKKNFGVLSVVSAG